MKRLVLCTLTTLAMTMGLAACGGGETAQTQPPTPQPTVQTSASVESQDPAIPEHYAFLAGDCTVSIGQDMAEVIAALGEPQSYFEAASCAFEGLDKTYTYPGFQIITRPDGDIDYVNSILLTDDSVTTPEGLYIGSSHADIIAVYGEGENTGSAIMYTKDDVTLSFILENDLVISIEYLPA